MKTRVIIADDHRVFSDGLSRLLEDNGIEVATCTTNRDELLDLILKHRPGVAIVDVAMPGLDIPSLLAALRAKKADTAVLVLTGSADSTAILWDTSFLEPR